MRKVIIIALSIIIALIIFSLCLKTCWAINGTLENILIGILTSAILLLFIEVITVIRDFGRFSYLNRDFRRVNIYNKIEERKNDKIYEDITPRYHSENVDSSIRIHYYGDGRFVGTAYYEEGKVKFEIFLDQINPSYGLGTYQYLQKTMGKETPDFGKLELIRDKVDSERIYIYHKNIAPSGLAEGYEVWESK